MVPFDLPLRSHCFDTLLKTKGWILYWQSPNNIEKQAKRSRSLYAHSTQCAWKLKISLGSLYFLQNVQDRVVVCSL